jgi:FSR family fosmidomycin resistance protein-like MFS transporter
MRTRPPGLSPTILRLATAHLVVDGYGNIYAPLLPLLIPRLDLSLTAAGALAMCFQLAASVSQLGFGHLADRWRPRVLVMAGPVVAVLTLSLIGLATSRLALGTILVIGGLGCAAFHPPAAAATHRQGGDRPGFAMSVYISGGTLGFSLVPLVFAPIADHLGLRWTPLMALPGLLILALFLPRAPQMSPERRGGNGGLRLLRPYAKPLTLLYFIVVLRTLTALSFTTFMPVMLTRRGLTVSQAASAFAAYLLTSGLGGFLGGPAADRYGPRRVVILSLVLCAPFLAIAPVLSGWPFMVVLGIGGFFLLSTLPINVTYGQLVAPVSAATVSSLMMGVAWGTAGLIVPIVGLFGDRLDIQRTLTIMGCLPLLAALFAWPLPPVGHVRAPSTPGAVGGAKPAPVEDVVR